MKLILLFLVLFQIELHAQDSHFQNEKNQPAQNEKNQPAQNENTFKSEDFIEGTQPKPQNFLSAQILNYRYVEGGLIADSGPMFGVRGDRVWTISSKLTTAFSGEFYFGQLKYDGSLCETNSDTCQPYTASTNDAILRLSQRMNFITGPQTSFFVGAGVRSLWDRGKGEGFYSRFGSYFFLPVGAQYYFNRDSWFIEGEFDVFLGGRMESRLSEVDPSYSDITHVQSSGTGHRITIGKGFSKTSFSLFYENWQIADSDLKPLVINNQETDAFFVEPKNFTEILGLKYGYVF